MASDAVTGHGGRQEVVRAPLAPGVVAPVSDARLRRTYGFEVIAVLAVSLGASGVYALLDLVRDLTRPGGLSNTTATVLGSQAPSHWVDLAFQLVDVANGLAPVLLVAYLLYREGVSLRVFGIDARHRTSDALRGAVLALVIGGSGLGLYLAAHAMHLAVTVEAANLPNVWWRYPVMILSAFQNGVLEEIVVLGYLLRRFDQMGWGPWRPDAASAVMRGSYHLYQGFGAFCGNAVMGIIFARLYRRWGRVTPMIIAHGLIDSVTFVGYALLAGHVSWLPS